MFCLKICGIAKRATYTVDQTKTSYSKLIQKKIHIKNFNVFFNILTNFKVET